VQEMWLLKSCLQRARKNLKKKRKSKGRQKACNLYLPSWGNGSKTMGGVRKRRKNGKETNPWSFERPLVRIRKKKKRKSSERRKSDNLSRGEG